MQQWKGKHEIERNRNIRIQARSSYASWGGLNQGKRYRSTKQRKTTSSDLYEWSWKIRYDYEERREQQGEMFQAKIWENWKGNRRVRV